jgi:hypothetical protein
MATRMRTVDQLKHIKQENDNCGCGIACIAMVARTNYDDVRKKIFGGEEKYLWWPAIRDALKGYRIKSDERARRVYGWQRVSQMNVFSVVWCRQTPSDTSDKIGHYVVWDRINGKVHDPLRNSAVDYSRIQWRPVSYLLVKPKARAAI